MANTKLTDLTENTDPIGSDILYLVNDPEGSPASQKATLNSLLGLVANGLTSGGRLTLVTGTPVTMPDVSDATTVFYTPYVHPYISLYDGSNWRLVEYTEKYLGVGAYTASKPYDIFGCLSSGTLALESLVWTNATTRATALTYQNGRLVKSGDATRLYLGSIYIDSDQKTDDSVLKRFVWNYYNRKERLLAYVNDGTTSWTIPASDNFRAFHNNVNWKVEALIGVSDDVVKLGSQILHISGLGYHSVAVTYDQIGLGTAALAAIHDSPGREVANSQVTLTSKASFYIAAGYHTFEAAERSEGNTCSVLTSYGASDRTLFGSVFG